MKIRKIAFLSIALSAVLNGCVIRPNQPTEVASLVASSKESSDARLTDCFAVFSFADQLAIVTDYHMGLRRNRSITLYNPSNGLFFFRGLTVESGTCRDVNVAAAIAHTNAYIDLYRITSAGARQILDNAIAAPTQLQSFISENPPYFRYDGKWQGESTALDIGSLHFDANHPAAEALKFISDADGARRLAIRNAQIEANAEANAQKLADASYAYNSAQQVWTDRLNANYVEGDRVCTNSGNYFGNIETITPERFKVHVIGQVHKSDGFFFSGISRNFTYEKIEAPRWFEKASVAHCVFE